MGQAGGESCRFAAPALGDAHAGVVFIMRQQVGALPIRWIGDEPRVLLVTSRETQRWIIPKGWRMRGRSNAEAAAQEALEEAGVRGRIRRKPIGRYRYDKRRADGIEECRITTYLLEVSEELDDFPEVQERRRAWFTLPEAASCADDEGLREILRDLAPQLAALRSRKAARKHAKAAAAGGAAKKAAGGASAADAEGAAAGPTTPPAKRGAGKAGAKKAAPRKKQLLGKKAPPPRNGASSPAAAASEAAE
jgi:8-oxo-dGTP pyrophosphatase MutT (NUDIX family)